MLTLRLTQSTIGTDRYRIDVALEGDGHPRQTASTELGFRLSPQEQEDLRWYLEDYLQYPFDPAPAAADRVEKRMVEVGTELFKAVFHADDDAGDLWAVLRGRLADTRVEIGTSVEEAAAIPWELIRDPKTDVPLALRAAHFVRSHTQPAQSPHIPRAESGPIRILLVICRPRKNDDVPFRSVAARLIQGLDKEARQVFHLDVLRPPTFEALGNVLRQAKADDRPYHVVHFDGHGTYLDTPDSGAVSDVLKKLTPLLLSSPRPGAHGYLLFENPAVEENFQLVGGPSLGELLVETRVPVLVLNACRSAHAEAPEEPETVTKDVHTEVRAVGSLAQEVMDAGVAGVVAMRYNVYVVTAAQFVAELYAKLVTGHPLGEAVTLGRKNLHDRPQREIAYKPIPLQDWMVPIVYEAAPIGLFPRPDKETPIEIHLDAATAEPGRGTIDAKLPGRPDVGFFGRDETLLALDRMFDTQSVVLLHEYAGSGKTSTAAEFARWYDSTGGVEGPVLCTSFEQYKTLPQVLDRLGQVFEPILQRDGINWLALNDEQRREVAAKVMKQYAVFWIWDNVEPIAGFPAGAKSQWTKAEQAELLDFLRTVRDTKAKFLLTSRRDEQSWLGELPGRVKIPPMPMQERVQLARALAEKRGHGLLDVDDWRPLLCFTQGNPMTLTVLVGQALRDGLKTAEQIETFVAQLRAGEAKIDDEESEGRTKSLAASLGYGFEHAFDEKQRKQLALLSFFQGAADVQVLEAMGHPMADYCLAEIRGLSQEEGIALLDRAAEIGLMTSHGRGCYWIHPALPWFFADLFRCHYHRRESEATRAFVEAMARVGNSYNNQYEDGDSGMIGALRAEEANLLHAQRLARKNGWWDPVISVMQGLHSLYDHTGRRAEWARLVRQIEPDFVDLATDGPLPGRGDDWIFITQYRVGLAREARQWAEAERLQRVCVDWARRQAVSVLGKPPKDLDDAQRNTVRTLAASLHELGRIQQEQGKAECVAAYEESHKLTERIGDQVGAATIAFNLGHAYMLLPAIRDLAEAEHWCRRSLDLRDENDLVGRAACLGQLGAVAHERFQEARATARPKEELLRLLKEALRLYHRAIHALPPGAVNELASMHGQLGNIFDDAGDLTQALSHWRDAIRHFEGADNRYEAGKVRRNVAVGFLQAGRLEDARDYAHAALRNYQTYGDGAAEEIQQMQQLIADIEHALRQSPGPT